MDIKEIDILGKNIGDHWYYWAKARAMSRLIADIQPKTILDVGAGSGFFSTYLLETTSAREAWCVDINYDADSDTLHNNKPVHFRRGIDRVDADLVLFMDVLEHVEDDVGLLREYMEKIPKGAKIVVSVPAFQILWSNHDVFLGHKRRYTLKSISKVIQKADVLLSRTWYFYGIVFPILSILHILQKSKFFYDNKIKSQLTIHNRMTNCLLKLLCGIELPIMHYNKFVGVTAFCLGEKM